MITNVSEYEKLAKKKLPTMVYNYYVSGAEDQWMLWENREAFSRILLATTYTPMYSVVGFRLLAVSFLVVCC